MFNKTFCGDGQVPAAHPPPPNGIRYAVLPEGRSEVERFNLALPSGGAILFWAVLSH